jgi:hypothetical protein
MLFTSMKKENIKIIPKFQSLIKNSTGSNAQNVLSHKKQHCNYFHKLYKLYQNFMILELSAMVNM